MNVVGSASVRPGTLRVPPEARTAAATMRMRVAAREEEGR